MTDPMNPMAPGFQNLKDKMLARVAGLDSESSVEEKSQALQDIAGWCWALGIANLSEAVDIWHRVAEQIGLPASTVDLEVRRYQRMIKREECAWFSECESGLSAEKFTALHCYTKDDPWWQKLNDRCQRA